MQLMGLKKWRFQEIFRINILKTEIIKVSWNIMEKGIIIGEYAYPMIPIFLLVFSMDLAGSYFYLQHGADTIHIFRYHI
jgi:hypothetical protein